MTAALRDLAAQYSAALREYCEQGGESALLRAYQLGRRAIGEGVGALEMAALHQEALVGVLSMLGADENSRVATRTSEFFAECLAPFELMRRGFQEAHSALRDLNQTLERRLTAALQDFEAAQGQLYEQRRIQAVKNDFISIMSHEVRTPLTSIHGAINLLKAGLGGDMNAQGQRLLDVCYRNSQRLVRLVNDLLDLQRIESGTMTFNLRPVMLAPLLEHSVDANQAFAGQLGVDLVLNRVPSGLHVRVDTDRFMQVMANLLSNAAKFSPSEGKVVVEARRRGRQVRVAITDHGPGVPAEFRSRIFQKFAQAQPASERGGSGLGLSITKAIVQSLSGRIDYESKPGRTTFYFDIPEWKPGASSHEGAGEDHWAAGH